MPTQRQALAALAFTLAAMLFATFATFAPDAHAQTEAEGTLLAQALNLRYGKIAPYCSPGAAYYCNGVLVRSIPENASDATDPTPDEAARNIVTLAYLRADAKVTKLASNAGFVVSDFNDAQAHGQPYQPYCVYAFAPSLADRNDHGCGMPGAAPAGQSDPSSCNALGIVDDQQWLAYYLDHGSDLSRQCSFSLLASQFSSALAVRQAPQVAAHITKPDAVLIRAWPLGYSPSLPIEAFFYVHGKAKGRTAAMGFRKAYYTATGRKVPVLQLDLTKSASVFDYDLADNPDHDFGHPIDEDIANELNARYQDDKSDICSNGKPGYWCSGILMRVTLPGPGYEIWDNTPLAHELGSVSFFYLRKDLTHAIPFSPGDDHGSGYLLHTPSTAAALGKPLSYNCIYPTDAFTEHGLDPATDHGVSPRKSAGCAPLKDPPKGVTWPVAGKDADLSSCRLEGIDTAQAWVTTFHPTPYWQLCSFSTVDATNFSIGLQAQRLLNRTDWWNELLIGLWPDHSPAALPIQAFFYSPSYAHGLSQAQQDQVDFCRATDQLLPVVRLNMGAAHGEVFAYLRSDQLDCL